MSHTVVKIEVIKGADAQGNGGTTVEFPIAIMPDETWEEIEEAMAFPNRWTPTVPNPKFDPSKKVSADNPETIPNPISKTWNVAKEWRIEAANRVRNRRRQLGLKQLNDAVKAGVKDAEDQIVVIEGNK